MEGSWGSGKVPGFPPKYEGLDRINNATAFSELTATIRRQELRRQAGDYLRMMCISTSNTATHVTFLCLYLEVSSLF